MYSAYVHIELTRERPVVFQTAHCDAKRRLNEAKTLLPSSFVPLEKERGGEGPKKQKCGVHSTERERERLCRDLSF